MDDLEQRLAVVEACVERLIDTLEHYEAEGFPSSGDIRWARMVSRLKERVDAGE